MPWSCYNCIRYIQCTKECTNNIGQKKIKKYQSSSMMDCDEGFRECWELGKMLFLENFTNLDLSTLSISARKTGTTGIPSILFLMREHSYLLDYQRIAIFF